MYKRFLSSAAFVSIMACSGVALAYETTTFSVALNDPSKTGTIAIDNTELGNGTLSIIPGSGTYVYNTAFQYFTPTESGTYVFGQLSSTADTVILLYSPNFDGTAPGTNFIEMNDDGYPTDVVDLDLQAYVTTALAGRSCDGDPDLCPLLVSNLTAGVDYYLVVSTYSDGQLLGAPTDILEFFVIGGSFVGVGGVPPAGYVAVSASSGVSKLATYLDGNDNSGQLAQVATYLDTATPDQVISALKEIFPVNAAVAGQIMSNVTGQTSTVLIDKVGTVLGNVGTLSAASFTDANFNTAGWIFGDKAASMAAPIEASFSQMDAGNGMGGGSGDMIASLAAMPYNRFEAGDHAMWVQGVGALTNGDGDEATHGYDSRNAGVVTGYEYALNQDNLVGMIASVFSSDINLDNNVGGTDATTYSLGVYGQHLMGTMKLTGMFLGSYGDYESHRYVEVGGVFGRPEAEYNGWGTSTTVALSKLFDHEGVGVEPFISANYSTSSTESYSENGGGAFNMDVSSDTSSTASIKGGVTLQNEFDVSDYKLDVKFKPYLGYQWELNEASNAIRLSGAASSVVVNGQDADTAQVGLAMETSLEISETSSFKIGVDLSKDQNQKTGLAYVGYGVKF